MEEPRKRKSDVHFALTFLEDAIDDVFDRAIIVSADSDYVPAVRKVRKRLPAKEIFLAIPPGRHGHARGLIDVCSSNTAITAGRLGKIYLAQRGGPLSMTPRQAGRRQAREKGGNAL